MILVDLNQIAISNLMVSLNSYNKNAELNEDLIRHMVMNSLRGHRLRFHEKYGELVICCDGRKYWRRGIFPFYKMGRKKARAASDLNWTLIFETLNNIRDDIKEYFPYKVIDIEGAEADDIIAVLSQYLNETTLILSGDKDFMQLQKYPNVDQYSPIQKKFMRTKVPVKFLAEHIIRGDTSDGIPNCLSPDDVFVNGSRQKSVTKKRLAFLMPVVEDVISGNKLSDKWAEPEDSLKDLMHDEEWRGFCRNRELIDFDYIPKEMKGKIIQEYDNISPKNRRGLLNYFIKHRMKQLIDCIQDF